MNTPAPQRVIVIMAGGSGTRLWPLSRKQDPKQFQALISDRTLLEETYARAAKLVPIECIYISTGAQYKTAVTKLLPAIQEENILVEPSAKNTAPAITLCTALIAKRFPQAHIATLASDHVIYNEEEFTKVFTTAFEALVAYPDSMITVGINPTRPDTGFGYIQMGDEKTTFNGQKVFSISHFKEKPDAATAKQYLNDWAYLWNAGYFIFAADSFLGWCQTYTPLLLSSIQKMLTLPDPEAQAALYAALAAVPIEPAIIEKLPPEKRLVIPSALDWSDVGTWATILEELQKLTGQSVILGSNHIDISSKNVLVKQSGSEKKFIGTIGLKDTIIIDTGDALLVADKNSVASGIKELLEKIKIDNPELL